jgi:hypothetical protein
VVPPKKELLQAGADERYVQRIASAETEEDLDDLSDYFHFYYSDLVERRKVRSVVVLRLPPLLRLLLSSLVNVDCCILHRSNTRGSNVVR